MGKTTFTTHELSGKNLIDPAKGKRIGKIHHFIFHPTQKRVVGATVKRPDAALMFHRKDAFVPLGSFTMSDGEVVLSGSLCSADKSVGKLIGVNWDDCIIWVGMPVITESGEQLGLVDNIRFDKTTGDVVSLTTANGITSDVLLGKYKISADLVRGFKRGKGEQLSQSYTNYNDIDPQDKGCILVSDEVQSSEPQGGVAVAAGKATAVATRKAKQEGAKVKSAIDEKRKQAQPVIDKAARKSGEAIDAGAFALGKQLGKTKGMFSAFKEELKNAYTDDEEESK